MLEMQNLTLRFGAQPVLVQVDLRLAAGERLGLVGPSGAGKSSLLRLAAGLLAPTQGTLRNTFRHPVLMFQEPRLLPWRNARDNVALPLAYGAVSPRAARIRAADLLAKLGLTTRLRHRPFELSSGQQQRVAIARALINRPSLLLADEPTGALDRRTGLEIMALFQHLNRQGNTIIVVTHDAEIAAIANRRIALVDGTLVEDVAVTVPVDAAEALAAQTPPQPPSVACVS